jgi:hypothetical protein
MIFMLMVTTMMTAGVWISFSRHLPDWLVVKSVDDDDDDVVDDDNDGNDRYDDDDSSKEY